MRASCALKKATPCMKRGVAFLPNAYCIRPSVRQPAPSDQLPRVQTHARIFRAVPLRGKANFNRCAHIFRAGNLQAEGGAIIQLNPVTDIAQAIDVYKRQPDVFSAAEKKAWIATQTGVTVGSDAFFPFGDNVERARKSGVQYIVEPGGSIRDDHVIDTANRYHMTMCFTGMRLFHH